MLSNEDGADFRWNEGDKKMVSCSHVQGRRRSAERLGQAPKAVTVGSGSMRGLRALVGLWQCMFGQARTYPRNIHTSSPSGSVFGRITLNSRQLANPHIDIMKSQSADQNQGVRARLVIHFLLNNRSVLQVRIPVIAMVTARQSLSYQAAMPIISKRTAFSEH